MEYQEEFERLTKKAEGVYHTLALTLYIDTKVEEGKRYRIKKILSESNKLEELFRVADDYLDTKDALISGLSEKMAREWEEERIKKMGEIGNIEDQVTVKAEPILKAINAIDDAISVYRSVEHFRVVREGIEITEDREDTKELINARNYLYNTVLPESARHLVDEMIAENKKIVEQAKNIKKRQIEKKEESTPVAE